MSMSWMRVSQVHLGRVLIDGLRGSGDSGKLLWDKSRCKIDGHTAEEIDPPPSVSLPRRSQIAPPSPSVSFEQIPSPRKSKSSIGVIHRPSTSNVMHSPPPDDINVDMSLTMGDEVDEAMVSQIVPKSTKKLPRKSLAQPDDEGDEDDGVEMGRQRLSVASRKSNAALDPDADTDDERPSEAGGPSFRFEEQNMDDGGGDMEDYGGGDDGGGDGGGDANEDEEADDDAALEEAAMAAEEDDVEEDIAPGQTKPRRPKPAVIKRNRKVDRQSPIIREKKKTRLSRLANGMSLAAENRQLFTRVQIRMTVSMAILRHGTRKDNISNH